MNDDDLPVEVNDFLRAADVIHLTFALGAVCAELHKRIGRGPTIRLLQALGRRAEELAPYGPEDLVQ